MVLPTTTRPAYVGWLRPNGKGPWRAVCSAPTDAEAFQLLLGHARMYRFVDLLTLPTTGQDPNVLPARRAGA
jgi:hypothetical protein